MAVPVPVTTIEQFEDFITQAENAERRFEFIMGEIVELVSNNYASIVAGWILYYIRQHLQENGLDGDITTTDGGYRIGNQRYMPDVGFISRTRQPEPSQETWNPTPPDLAVEVLSPTDDLRKAMIKVGNYLAVGSVVWVVDPAAQTVDIYRPCKAVVSLGIDGTIEDNSTLPGFSLPVSAIFPSVK